MTTTCLDAATHLSDGQLLVEVKATAGRERKATARLIAFLAELDARRLYPGEGYSSLFTYCTHVLRLSEHAAYGRIAAARAARAFPAILDRLTDDSLTLTAVTLLAPHLTPENHLEILDAARHQGKRAIEAIVARLRPQPAVPATIRKLPAPVEIARRLQAADGHAEETPLTLAPPPSPRPALVTPLAPERYKVQVTLSRATHDKLRRAQDLLHHAIPTGDLAVLLDRALTLLLSDLEKGRLAAAARLRTTRAPTEGSRHIPAAVRRTVWARDHGQCAFVGAEGRCSERAFLEFHHIQPHAVGGTATVENIALRCRAHNLHEAEEYFGRHLPLLVRERQPRYGTSSVWTEFRRLRTTFAKRRPARLSIERTKDPGERRSRPHETIGPSTRA